MACLAIGGLVGGAFLYRLSGREVVWRRNAPSRDTQTAPGLIDMIGKPGGQGLAAARIYFHFMAGGATLSRPLAATASGRDAVQRRAARPHRLSRQRSYV